MADREQIRAALAAWRAAEERLAEAVDGEADALTREVADHQAEFQRLSSELVVEQTTDDAMRAVRWWSRSARLSWPRDGFRSDDER